MEFELASGRSHTIPPSRVVGLPARSAEASQNVLAI
jgi:hypothetical protein